MVQAIQNKKIPLQHPSMEKMGSIREVPGFDDLDDVVVAEHGMTQRNLRLAHAATNVLDKEIVKEKSGLLENSNSKWGNEGSEDSIERSSNSGSRTKTVSFSQNGYSEEVFKVSQHLKQPVRNASPQSGVGRMF